jgi:hypothetical protein
MDKMLRPGSRQHPELGAAIALMRTSMYGTGRLLDRAWREETAKTFDLQLQLVEREGSGHMVRFLTQNCSGRLREKDVIYVLNSDEMSY